MKRLTEPQAIQVAVLLEALDTSAAVEMTDPDWHPVDRMMSHLLCLMVSRVLALTLGDGKQEVIDGHLEAIERLTQADAWSSASMASQARALAREHMLTGGVHWNPVPDFPDVHKRRMEVH